MTEVKVEIFVEGGLGAPLASVSTREMTVVEGHMVTMSCQASGEFRSNWEPKKAASIAATLVFFPIIIIISSSSLLLLLLDR